MSQNHLKIILIETYWISFSYNVLCCANLYLQKNELVFFKN